jgi:hypothetical protein
MFNDSAIIRKSHERSAFQALVDKLLIVEPDLAVEPLFQVRMTVLAEPSLELAPYPHLVFHGDLSRQLDIALAKLGVLLESRVCLEKELFYALLRNLSFLSRLLFVPAKCHEAC